MLLIAVVLAVTGAFGGDDDGGEATAGSPTTTTASQSDERAVPITMRPEKGSDAGGAVVFGFATADQPFIEFQIRNLEPAANGDAYVLWFLLGQGQGFPLPTALNVSANGSLSDRIPVPPEVIAFAQQAKSIVIALNDGQKLNREITEAVNRRQRCPGLPRRNRALRGPQRARLGQQLPRIHDPGGVEALLDGPQRLEPQLPHLGAHVGGVIAPDRVVVRDRALSRNDRLAGGGLDRPPLLDLLARAARGRRR